MADIFDGAVNWEEQCVQEGHAEGLREGEAAARREGRELGIQKGLELGAEVGYYSGCAKVWRQWLIQNSHEAPERLTRALSALEATIQKFLPEPQDEGLQEKMDQMRSKFKTIVTLLKLQQEYLSRGHATAAASDISF